jgi:hypothetical protein
MAHRRLQVAWAGSVLAAALTLPLGADAKDPKGKADEHAHGNPPAAKAAAGEAQKAEKNAPAGGQHGAGAKAEQGAGKEKGAAPPKGEAKGHEPHGEHGAAKSGDEGRARANEERAEPAKEAAAERAERRAERAEYKSKVAELRERQAAGKLSKDELKKELAALRESRAERRQARREALRERWGQKLAEPSVQQELRHHERRMAQLERMALLAQTDRSGKAKDALVARIDKLTERENQRHERKLSQLETKAGNTRPASAVETPAPKGAKP